MTKNTNGRESNHTEGRRNSRNERREKKKNIKETSREHKSNEGLQLLKGEVEDKHLVTAGVERKGAETVFAFRRNSKTR